MKYVTHNQHLLASLRDSIVDKPPYINGTLQLSDSCFSLFYKIAKDSHAARYINLANASPDELEQLGQACESVKQELVLDETYSEAGKMDSEYFSSMLDLYHTDLIRIIRGYLLEAPESTKGIKAELYKLNIYSKGSSIKPHVDTPRREKMFGSLVVVFPTPHEGGALFLRHRGREWIFDPGETLAGGCLGRPSMHYVAFLNDVEQEVAPVTSGHCVTMTYNLYFDDYGAPIFEKDVISEHFILPKPPNQDTFREAFIALLENPEFMADGGMLGFGPRHGYTVEDRGLDSIYKVLKGSDAVIYQSVRALGFEPALHMYYEDDISGPRPRDQGVIVDVVVCFGRVYDEVTNTTCRVAKTEGGILVRQDGWRVYIDWGPDRVEYPEPMEWVTPLMEYNRKDGSFVSDYDKTEMNWAYGDLCMIVRIGKAGDRLGYPGVEQVNDAYLASGALGLATCSVPSVPVPVTRPLL